MRIRFQLGFVEHPRFAANRVRLHPGVRCNSASAAAKRGLFTPAICGRRFSVRVASADWTFRIRQVDTGFGFVAFRLERRILASMIHDFEQFQGRRSTRAVGRPRRNHRCRRTSPTKTARIGTNFGPVRMRYTGRRSSGRRFAGTGVGRHRHRFSRKVIRVWRLRIAGRGTGLGCIGEHPR